MSQAETDPDESHRLVEQAFALAKEKLEQPEVTIDDMRDVRDALQEALDHPGSDVWTTITALGPKNQCDRHIDDAEVKFPPGASPRETLENIVNHTIEMKFE